MTCLRSLSIVPLVAALWACSEVPSGEESSTGESGESSTGETSDSEGEALRPNWHQDIAPIVYGSCVGCHRDGGIAPFSLETYDQAAPWAALVDEVVADGLMPPWGALETEDCQLDHEWANDVRLSDETKQLFTDWVAAGSPEGDPAEAAELPAPPSLDLDDASLILQNPSPFTVGGTEDSFICYSIDPELDEDVWIDGIQLVPDNEQVVHHVLIYADPTAASAAVADANGSYPCFGTAGVEGAELIATWVPGAVPTEMPDNVGLALPQGSRIILAYHYHPTGAGDETDQSSVALRFTEDSPIYVGRQDLLGNFFTGAQGLLPGPNDPGGNALFYIPPNVADHTETMRIVLPDVLPPVDLFSLGTHMHYVGVDMRVWIERDGEEICMIQTPRWDFDWQRNYTIAGTIGSFPKVQGGDVVMLECTYDNTLNNPALAGALAEAGLDEPTEVLLGESSLEEMCLLLFGVAYPNFP